MPTSFSNPRQIWRRALGICIGPWNTGPISPIQFLSPWRSTTLAPVVLSVGVVGTALPRYPKTSFFKRSISPQRVDTSSQLSTATISINDAEACDERGSGGSFGLVVISFFGLVQ